MRQQRHADIPRCGPWRRRNAQGPPDQQGRHDHDGRYGGSPVAPGNHHRKPGCEEENCEGDGRCAAERGRLHDRQEFDLVAVGRALLVDPDWAQKVREGRMQDVLPFSREALKTLA